MSDKAEPKDSLAGVGAAALAYSIWGVVVVYWKLLDDVSSWEVLSHRVLWCLVFLAPIVLLLGRWGAIKRAFATRRSLLALLASSLLIGSNWGIFIWAVQEGRIVESSLGYYINPFFVTALGIVFLGERLSIFRIVAFSLAGLGVAVQAIALGGLPWISLVLAASFALYGYVRKVVNVEALDGLFVETLVIAPLAIVYLIYLGREGTLAFASGDWVQTALLIGAGPVTAIPLWLFAVGARGVRLSTVGLLQYIGPTLSLILAVGVYHEPFDTYRLISFGLIWTALVVVTLEVFRRPPVTVPETC